MMRDENFQRQQFYKSEKKPFNQVMSGKTSDMQRIIQVAQRVAQKSLSRARQLFCFPIDALLYENGTCCCHQPAEDKTTPVALQNLPSTILIVNISNSTLIDCVIGNDTYPSVVAESQPLMRESELQMQGRCGCSCGQQEAAHTSTTAPPPPPPPPLPLCPPLPSAETQSINIHSSLLNCVIIGDNNYMHAEQSETEEPQM